MKKQTKVWLIIAASLVLVGGMMFAGVMSRLGWDFTKLSTTQYETATYPVSQDFHSIFIQTDTSDIVFAVSEDESCKVVCYEPKNIKHTVEVKDGTLEIRFADERKWYEHIGIHIGSPKITVYLPQREYTVLLIEDSTGSIDIPGDFRFESMNISTSTGDVTCFASATERITICADTGDVCVEALTAGALDISVSTGDVIARSVTCEGDVTVESDTGHISLSKVVAMKSFFIESSTGDVTFTRSDAAGIYVKTSTGDVTGDLLFGKEFVARSDTGKVSVPKNTTGGRCEITTSTGDIEIVVSSLSF